MSSRRMARADLVTGGLLFVLSVVVIYGAWTMDRLEFRQIHPSSVPGLTPGLLGIALALSSALLTLNAARKLAVPHTADGSGDGSGAADGDPGSRRRLVGAAVLCLLYSLVLIGRMPFELATALFVTAFIGWFEWRTDDGARARFTRFAWAVFLGVATGFVVAYVFRDIFLVRLP